MRNPSLLIYNMVNGIIDTNLPIPIYDYNSMYKILQPFILTKEIYEQGVQSRNESDRDGFYYLPESDRRERVNTLQEEPIKISFIELDPQPANAPTQPPPPPNHPPQTQTQPQRPPHLPIQAHTQTPPPPNHPPNTTHIPKITNTTKHLPRYTSTNSHTNPDNYPPTLPQPHPPAKNVHKLPNEPAPQFVSIHTQADPLFWCLFISLNGIKEYQYLTGRYTNRIVDEKQKLVNFLKVNDTSIKPFLKKNKITGVSMKMIMSGILSNEPVDFKNVILYCYYYRINVAFVYSDKHVYFTVVGNEEEVQKEDQTEVQKDNNMHYIEFSLKIPSTHSAASNTPHTAPAPAGDKKYKYSILTDQEKIKQSKTYFNIENVEKPLNAMASYKINELTAIAEQLGLLDGDKETGNKLKKNDLYKLINDFFKEFL